MPSPPCLKESGVVLAGGKIQLVRSSQELLQRALVARCAPGKNEKGNRKKENEEMRRASGKSHQHQKRNQKRVEDEEEGNKRKKAIITTRTAKSPKRQGRGEAQRPSLKMKKTF